jgi:hypothetical protein
VRNVDNDFANPQNKQFHAINQFCIDAPDSVKTFIVPDIVLLINSIPPDCHIGSDASTTDDR